MVGHPIAIHPIGDTTTHFSTILGIHGEATGHRAIVGVMAGTGAVIVMGIIMVFGMDITMVAAMLADLQGHAPKHYTDIGAPMVVAALLHLVRLVEAVRAIH